MNKPLLTVACALLGTSLFAQNIKFVSTDGTGDGSSWDSPAALHATLSTAKSGDVLWLKAGTYFTTTDDNRDIAFRVNSGVDLLGGFSGSEKNASNRNPVANPTILSAEIGTKSRNDNAYTVLILEDVDNQTLIDGVTLQGAYANGAGAPGDPKRAGGAALVNVSKPGQVSSPTFSNCIFSANYARDGGAVYIDGRAGVARPNFVNCTFLKNEADLDGGAVYNDGRRHGEASPSFVGCLFDENIANYGGAIFNQATKGTSSPKLAKCTFRANHAYIRGASLYNIDHQGMNQPTLVECIFENLNDEEITKSGVARVQE